MTRRTRRRPYHRIAGHDERGAAIVEFAIVAPILLLIMFGLFEFGLAIYRLQGVHAASRDAARIGASAQIGASEVEARALSSLGSTLLEHTPVITIEPNTAYPCADHAVDEIVVTIEARDDLTIPFWDSASITLASRAEFPCER